MTEVVWPDEDLRCFQLPDGSWGTPACDVCDDNIPNFAVVCIDGQYLCDLHMERHEAVAILDMLERLEPNEQELT